jgi:hypothetical protein
MQRRLFPDYLTQDYIEASRMWGDWKTLGNIRAGGSMDQPALWLDIIETFNDCAAIMSKE